MLSGCAAPHPRSRYLILLATRHSGDSGRVLCERGTTADGRVPVTLRMTRSYRVCPIGSLIGAFVLAATMTWFATACTSKCRPGATLKDGRCIATNASAATVVAGTVAGESALPTAGGGSLSASEQSVTGSAGNSGANSSVDGPTSANVAGGSAAAAGNAPAMISGAVAGGSASSCAPEGAIRCATSGTGAREGCVGGAWQRQAACAVDELCMTGATATSCVKVERACTGFEGQVICDNDGLMLICAEDGSATSSSKCSSRALCEAGIATQTCAVCVPGAEYRCAGATLEVCVEDGKTFTPMMECESAPLCDASSGSCTEATCEAGKASCDGNTLLKCNSDATGFEVMMPCGQATCDSEGGDCNKCDPGTRTCEQDNVLTCDASGQNYSSESCSGGRKCVDDGRCVECVNDRDCSRLSTADGCKVGVCQGESCTTSNATFRACVGEPGMCTGGRCVCNANCSGKCGGDDGCGGRCPDNCSNGQECENDVCVAVGRKLYEQCTPGSSMQGDCIAGHSCIGVGGRGAHCFQNGPCSIAQVMVFGMVCAQPCTPTEPNGSSSACPSTARFCFSNGETGVETDGYCIP